MDDLVYSTTALDRKAWRRSDAVWLSKTLHSGVARIVPIHRQRNLIAAGAAPEAIYLPVSAVEIFDFLLNDFVFLGVIGGKSYFACDLSVLDANAVVGIAGAGSRFEDLRNIGSLLSNEEAGLLAYARGIVHWHKCHRYCGTCGTETYSSQAGHVRVCRDQACGTIHFPRLDPAVIMLVCAGSRCALGRNRGWAPGLYATFAGFVETGETLEQAVRREIEEETGLAVGRIQYWGSQPWPFPSSLMIGFIADARTTNIDLAHSELDDVRWFTSAELQAAEDWLPTSELGEAGDGKLRIPRKESISRLLIDQWLDVCLEQD